MKTIGIIGAGNFGNFMELHLKNYTSVCMFDRDDSNEILKKVCSQDVVIFAVPFPSLEEAITMTKKYIKQETILIDVSSTKEKPLLLLEKNFPKNPLIGTHPIFGPESGKDGISGLSIVITNINASEQIYTSLHDFLSQKLELKVIEQSPKQHDKEMAYVQGLSHFIGKALKNMDIENFPIATSSYKQLITLKDLLKNDSWALFETIENGNNYTEEVRTRFMKELQDIENKLGE